MPTTVSTQTKGLLFTQKAMAVEQLEEGHMVSKKTKKQETIMLLHPTTKPYSVSLFHTHKHTHAYGVQSIAHQFRTRGVGVVGSKSPV